MDYSSKVKLNTWYNAINSNKGINHGQEYFRESSIRALRVLEVTNSLFRASASATFVSRSFGRRKSRWSLVSWGSRLFRGVNTESSQLERERSKRFIDECRRIYMRRAGTSRGRKLHVQADARKGNGSNESVQGFC